MMGRFKILVGIMVIFTLEVHIFPIIKTDENRRNLGFQFLLNQMFFHLFFQ